MDKTELLQGRPEDPETAEGIMEILEKVHAIFINLRDADEGEFPPFAVSEALIRSLITSVHGGNKGNG